MKFLYYLLIIALTISLHTANASESASISIDLNKKLTRGVLLKVSVHNSPVFIVYRRPNEIDVLRKQYAKVKAPVPGCEKCAPSLRSISPDYLVVWGNSPSSKCALTYASSTAKDWAGHAVSGRGGFVDQCSGAEYDLSGRKLMGPKTAPKELEIPHHILREGIIVFDTEVASKH